MASRFILPYSFTYDSGTQNALAPVSNLNSDIFSLVWQSAATVVSGTIIVNLGSANAAAGYDTVALIGTNFRAGDAWRVRCASTNALTGGYDSGTISTFSGTLPAGSTSKCILKLPSTQTYQFVGIDFTTTGNPAGFAQAQRLVVGRSLSLANGAGVDLGHQITFMDQSVAYTGPNWSTFDAYNVLAQMKLSVSLIGDSDWRTDWYGFLQSVGKNKAFLVIPDDTQPANWQAEAVFGRIIQDAATPLTSYGIRRTDLVIQSLAP